MIAHDDDNKHWGHTTILWKSELFIRQFIIPYNIATRLLMSVTEEDVVCNTYNLIQREIDQFELRTNDCAFSFQDTRNLYNYLFESYKICCNTTDTSSRNEFRKIFKSRFMELPLTIYTSYLQALVETRRCKKQRKKYPAHLASVVKIPGFIVDSVTTELDVKVSFDHFLRYFEVFCYPMECGVIFHFDQSRPQLGLHVIAIHPHFDDSVLTVIAEPANLCCSVDRRSLFASKKYQKGLHGFGVGSYVSHAVASMSQLLCPI